MKISLRHHFNVDKYLDAQLQAGVTPHRYGWCGRLNDWIEAWKVRWSWGDVDIWLGNLCSIFLAAAALYLIYILHAAWESGAFQAMVSR
jgi:hypothetical protein